VQRPGARAHPAGDGASLASGFIGYTTSLAALGQETEIRSTLRRVEPAAARYMTERGMVFAELVEGERRRRLDAPHHIVRTAQS
jgi:hypothetical protein